MTALKVGDIAPDFTLPAHNGPDVTLNAYRGEQTVLIAFHPATFTGG